MRCGDASPLLKPMPSLIPPTSTAHRPVAVPMEPARAAHPNLETQVLRSRATGARSALRPQRLRPPSLRRPQARTLARLLQASHPVVVFTGAGVSTGAGLPTVRGRFRARGARADELEDRITHARPTTTHMALVALERCVRCGRGANRAVSSLVARRAGLVHLLCTQNVDNLHHLSGFPRDKIWDAHGNAFTGVCSTCGAVYHNPVPAACPRCFDPARHHRPTRRSGLLRRGCVQYGDRVVVPAAVRELVMGRSVRVATGVAGG